VVDQMEEILRLAVFGGGLNGRGFGGYFGGSLDGRGIDGGGFGGGPGGPGGGGFGGSPGGRGFDGDPGSGEGGVSGRFPSPSANLISWYGP
jgi:hypothetical protein